MSVRVRNGLILAVIGIFLIGAGFIVLTNLLGQNISPRSVSTPIPSVTNEVLVTTHDIPFGTVLTREDILLIEVPVELIPRNAISDVEDVLRRITKTQLVQGQIILEHQLADPTNISHDQGYILSEDHVLMAFPAEDLISRLSVLQQGDLVDIFVSITETGKIVGTSDAGLEQEEKATLFTFDALQGVTITALIIEVIPQEEETRTVFSSSEDQPEPEQLEPIQSFPVEIIDNVQGAESSATRQAVTHEI